MTWLHNGVEESGYHVSTDALTGVKTYRTANGRTTRSDRKDRTNGFELAKIVAKSAIVTPKNLSDKLTISYDGISERNNDGKFFVVISSYDQSDLIEFINPFFDGKMDDPLWRAVFIEKPEPKEVGYRVMTDNGAVWVLTQVEDSLKWVTTDDGSLDIRNWDELQDPLHLGNQEVYS